MPDNDGTLARLERLNDQMLAELRQIDRRLTQIEERTKSLTEDMADKVGKGEFAPIKSLMYGVVAMILSAFMAALIATTKLGGA